MKKKWDNKSWGSSFDGGDFYRKKEWRSLRESYIQLNPLCELHLQFDMVEPGYYLDHIVPRRINEKWELEEFNLQILCKDCHNKKSGIEKDIKDLHQFIKEMKSGKLQFITTEEKKEIIIKKGLI